MSIEAGSRVGLVAVDDTTLGYVEGRPYAPKDNWEQAVDYWQELKSDNGAIFDKVIEIDATKIEPQVTWGTSPEMVISVNQAIPDPSESNDVIKRKGIINALNYMDLEPGMRFDEIKIDKVFIGSCTNSRIEDLRAAAAIVKGRKVSKDIKLAMVVPGSGLIKRQAEDEGLAKIFIDSGFEWRDPGCSMCLGMNPDQLQPGSRHSIPESIKILANPSSSACRLIKPDPGTTIANLISLETFLPLTIAAAARKSSIREFVHEPINTLSILISSNRIPGSKSI
jgi:3-isopropylmalate/(R)-2-methylmalate dehydratase large subunit